MRDEPRAPAQAYHLVAALISSDYFERQPPDVGRRVSVAAADGVATVWDMGVSEAELLVAKLRRFHPGVRVSSSGYQSRRSA